MNKKLIIIGGVALLAALLIVLLIVNSCNKQTTSEITVLTYNDEEKDLKDTISSFEENNNIKVNLIKKDLQNYELESLNLITSGKVDVWEIPNDWVPKQHDKLSSQSGSAVSSYKDSYPESVVADNVIGDQIYGYPLTADALVMYTNNDLKSEIIGQISDNLTSKEDELVRKTPENWDEFIQQVQLLTQKSGNSVSIAGTALGSANIPSGSQILTAMMLQQGTQMTNEENTQATFHTAINKFGGESYPGARALSLFASFGQPNNANFSFDDSFGNTLRAFAEGKIIYYFDFSNKQADIDLINPDLNYNVNIIPQVKETKNPLSVISYGTYTVPKNSINNKTAWEFVDFLTNENNVELYTDKTEKTPVLNTFLENSSDVVAQSIKMSQTWYDPDPTEVNKLFQSAISQAVAGTNAQTVLDGTAIKVTNLLEKIKG